MVDWRHVRFPRPGLLAGPLQTVHVVTPRMARAIARLERAIVRDGSQHLRDLVLYGKRGAPDASAIALSTPLGEDLRAWRGWRVTDQPWSIRLSRAGEELWCALLDAGGDAARVMDELAVGAGAPRAGAGIRRVLRRSRGWIGLERRSERRARARRHPLRR